MEPQILRWHENGSKMVECRGNRENQTCNSQRDVVRVDVIWLGKATVVNAPVKPKVRFHPTRQGLLFIDTWDNAKGGEYDLYERLTYRRERENSNLGGDRGRKHSYLEVHPAVYK